jgi:hypothetical protein
LQIGPSAVMVGRAHEKQHPQPAALVESKTKEAHVSI